MRTIKSLGFLTSLAIFLVQRDASMPSTVSRA